MNIFINGYGLVDIPHKPHREYSELDGLYHEHPGYDINVCKCGNPFWVVKDYKSTTCGRIKCKEE